MNPAEAETDCRGDKKWSFKGKARGDTGCSELDDGDEDAGDGHQRAHHPKEIGVYTLVERANLFTQRAVGLVNTVTQRTVELVNAIIGLIYAVAQ